MGKKITFCMLTLLLLSGFAMAGDNAPFKINITLTAPLGTSERQGFLDLVVTEMLHRVGRVPDFEFAHEERGLRALDQGLDDGNLPRVAGLEKIYPNIRQVPGKVMDFNFQVFSKNPDIVIDGWESLRDYDVAFVTGWKILEQNIKARTVTKVSTSEQLFWLLDQDRTQLVIYEKWQGLELIRKLGLRGIQALEPPLITKEVFLYVYKRHEKLIPELAHALEQMKRDGSYQRIENKTLGPLLNP
ncbi:MAG: transporter substrate-binding domain-containing protein [Candidatus Sedimenticola sp. (ex Thyasira tokunagai)]